MLLRHAEWLNEIEEPIGRAYLLNQALPTWESMRITLLASNRSASDPDSDNEQAVQQDRTAWETWTCTVLDAATVPLVVRTASIEYMATIQTMAQREFYLANQSYRAIRILDRALELASKPSKQPVHNSANQSPAELVWTAASQLVNHHHYSNDEPHEPYEPHEFRSDQAPLPEPLPTLLSTDRGTTRSGRTTLRARLAQLEMWKQECVHVPHLWLEGAPPEVRAIMSGSTAEPQRVGLGLSSDSNSAWNYQSRGFTTFTDELDSEQDAQFEIRLQDQVAWWEAITQYGVRFASSSPTLRATGTFDAQGEF